MKEGFKAILYSRVSKQTDCQGSERRICICGFVLGISVKVVAGRSIGDVAVVIGDFRKLEINGP